MQKRKPPVDHRERLQRRASYQTRKGRCSTLNCCMSLSLNRRRFKETCSSRGVRRDRAPDAARP
ncbi:hypothetical protein CO661_08800 [Sinorhizobium fredii]|uniref:Uncharacterized protein n=1 Tax=Rhizobium fredii TaxID=380 RepID=A0A2A6M1A3_RHIFR|nr:hypothetical protein [Sinorhizobium fredii]MQX07913.1 hypothetical protein [Sinorhizobium fredii]PDT48551.1 hypothetical protein CO661_08800 [Sinorhizobium fredii]UTY51582.1 hypothetical protein EPK84_33500 [Sinorhizobium fredii]